MKTVTLLLTICLSLKVYSADFRSKDFNCYLKSHETVESFECNKLAEESWDDGNTISINQDSDNNHFDPEMTILAFPLCYGQGCVRASKVYLTADDLGTIIEPLLVQSLNSIEEREKIAKAISMAEKIVGEYTNTRNDLPGTFKSLWSRNKGHQMDCTDEAANATTYLNIFNKLGLLQWHNIYKKGIRILGWWPHTAASIKDRRTGKRYIVDSWFHANGHLPEILPYSKWVKGWKPKVIKD